MESKWCLVHSRDAVVAKLDELVGKGCRRITYTPDAYDRVGNVCRWFVTYVEPETKPFIRSELNERLEQACSLGFN